MILLQCLNLKSMNRTWFISLFTIAFGGGYVYGHFVDWDEGTIFMLLSVFILTGLRRKYLGMSWPWLGGTLCDIVTYFKAP
ncbi:hypothetical protein PEPS_07730 [Persicobacter psychrovividus]|uniref:Uncharacterized protein n=2 Tax=Persicobacter psychrovividus TaxID=387638 RepID=A0ABN6L5S3_9BACT|nr:hypothetical protein PEPS_07730 [Persicobacter psychrovividus]